MKQYQKILLSFFLLLVGAMILLGPQATGAVRNVVEEANRQMNVGAEKSGLKLADQEAVDPRLVVIGIIQTVMGAFGIALTTLVVIAGYMYVTSNGEEEKIIQAKKIISGAMIGLLLVVMSYSISYFVSKYALQATGFGQ